MLAQRAARCRRAAPRRGPPTTSSQAVGRSGGWGWRTGLLGVVTGLACSLASPMAAAKTQIVLWTLGPIYQQVFETLRPEFEKAFPDIELNIQYSTSASKLAVALAGGAAPDIATLSTRDAPQFIEAGGVIPVYPPALGARNLNEVLNQYYPGMAAVLRYKGHVYFLPTEVTSLGLYIHQDLLEQAGIATAPRTWEELGTVSRKLTKAQGEQVTQVGLAMNRSAVWVALYWASLLRQKGLDWIDANGHPNFSKPEAQAAIQVYADLFRNGAAHPAMASAAFRQGKAVFLADGTYQSFYFLQNQAGFRVGSAPYPMLAGGQPNVTTYAWGLYVTSASKQPDQAWRVVRFFTDPKFAPVWLGKGGLLQPHRGQWLLELLQKTPILRPFVEGLEFGQMEIAHPRYGDISRAIQTSEAAIVSGQTSLQEALLQLDRALEPILMNR